MAKRNVTVTHYAVWPTAWGPIGAAASEAGLCRLVLPHYELPDLQAMLAWEFRKASCDDAPFAELIERTRAYFNGRRVDFGDIRCDLPSERTFAGKVLRACREVPYGGTTSYGRLAECIGRPEATRAVAGAVGANPVLLVVPCHRVVYADGRLSGFSAPGGPELKRRMLALEKPSP